MKKHISTVKSILIPGCIIAAGLFMLKISWRRWPDVLIDFGRELYIPWQINAGSVLYKDIAYFNGPVSPYLNALVFRVFGTSIMALALFNIAVAALIAIIIYRIFCVISDRFTAFLTSLTFVTVFASSQYVKEGNYNYICPYSHDMTHGILLALSALYVFYLTVKNCSVRNLFVLGLLLGSVFLTKIEVFVACASAVIAGIIAFFVITGERPSAMMRSVAVLCASACVPVVAFSAYFLSHTSLSCILSSIVSPYRSILKSDVTSGIFYKMIMGLDDPFMNTLEMFHCVIVYLTIMTLIALAGAGIARIADNVKRRMLSGLLAINVILWARLFINKTGWIIMASQGLPIAMVILLAAAVLHLNSCRGSGRDGGERPRALLLFSMAVFALSLMLKIVLRVNIFHYGFALAMPAFLLLVAVFSYAVPEFFGKRLGGGVFMRIAGTFLVVWCIVSHVMYSKHILDRKTYPVGSGADTILTHNVNSVTSVLNESMARIKEIVPKGKSLAVMPEGIMINYLTRISNPTPYVNFMPLEFSIFGEDNILSAFRANPPDFIALTGRETGEYGYRFFGRDYALRLFAWIVDNYDPMQLVGDEPLTGKSFGVLLLRKRP